MTTVIYVMVEDTLAPHRSIGCFRIVNQPAPEGETVQRLRQPEIIGDADTIGWAVDVLASMKRESES